MSQLSKRRIATYVFTYLICRACPRRAVTATSALDGIDFYTQRFLHNIHPVLLTNIHLFLTQYNLTSFIFLQNEHITSIGPPFQFGLELPVPLDHLVDFSAGDIEITWERMVLVIFSIILFYNGACNL